MDRTSSADSVGAAGTKIMGKGMTDVENAKKDV